MTGKAVGPSSRHETSCFYDPSGDFAKGHYLKYIRVYVCQKKRSDSSIIECVNHLSAHQGYRDDISAIWNRARPIGKRVVVENAPDFLEKL